MVESDEGRIRVRRVITLKNEDRANVIKGGGVGYNVNSNYEKE